LVDSKQIIWKNHNTIGWHRLFVTVNNQPATTHKAKKYCFPGVSNRG
jgi:hypothetical protein